MKKKGVDQPSWGRKTFTLNKKWFRGKSENRRIVACSAPHQKGMSEWAEALLILHRQVVGGGVWWGWLVLVFVGCGLWGLFFLVGVCVWGVGPGGRVFGCGKKKKGVRSFLYLPIRDIKINEVNFLQGEKRS